MSSSLAASQTVTHQSPLSTGFLRQEYWSGLPFPSLEDLPDPGIKPGSPSLGADALTSEPPGKPYIFACTFSFYKCHLDKDSNPKRIAITLFLSNGGAEVKASASNAGDPVSIPGLGRSPGEGNGNPLQYSCLENPMDGEA